MIKSVYKDQEKFNHYERKFDLHEIDREKLTTI